MEAAIEFVGADLCVGPGTVSRGRHHGRTHRSAPTRGGRRLGTNGNWCGTMPFPAGRDGARPLQGSRSRVVYGGVWSPRPAGASPVVPGNGPMYLGHGFRRPNFAPKFGASVMGIGPYAPRGTGERHAGVVVPYGKPDQPPKPAGAQRSVRASGREGWAGIDARTIPKGGPPRDLPGSA